MRRALNHKTDVRRAMFRKEVGQIDFLWGTPGDKSKDYAHGWGVSHILAKHGKRDAMRLPYVLAKGAIKNHPEQPDTKKLVTYGDYLVSLSRRNKHSVFIITGFVSKHKNRRQVGR